MKKKIVARVNYNRMIVRITDHTGQETYKIKQGNKYIGKTTEGGYKHIRSAIKAATRLV